VSAVRATFTLGRIAGVRIGVNWSVLLIFGLVAFGLAAGRLPEGYPDRPWPVYAVVGLVTAVVFFASLLAHELAHAVVARRHGVGVDDIVLWLLGGATRMRAEAPSPAAELRISGAGPLVSAVLGVLFALCAWLLNAAGAGPGVEGAAWLAAINVLLAVFNTIPAAPLDGGRLLRSFLWWRTGSRLRATAGAATAGQVFGWTLLVAGLLGFLWTAWPGGLWLALVGWFLLAAAAEEGRQARVRELLTGMAVRDAMTPDPVTAPARLTVGELLADGAFGGRHAAFPVAGRGEGAAPVGLVTVDRAGHVPPEERPRTTVDEIMLPLQEARVAAPDEALGDLVPRLEPGPEHRVLVLERGRLVGIVAPSDINQAVRQRAAHPRR
jgi:Zn-dependent protease